MGNSGVGPALLPASNQFCAWQWRTGAQHQTRALEVVQAIRMTMEESTRLRAAYHAGMSVSAYVRHVLLTEPDRVVIDVERIRQDLQRIRSAVDDAAQLVNVA